MKKLFSSMVVVALAISAMLFMGGCKITPEQAKVIAQNAGIYSAVIWIAVDNPTSNQIAEVKGILDVIKDNATKIESGKTYVEVVYPEVVKVIDTKIPPQDRPFCKAAAMTLLNGLDTLFAMHPDWKADQTLALQIVDAYIVGAQSGLGMDEGSDIMKQARAAAAARAKIYSAK